MIAMGTIAERGRLGPAFVFIFIWATLVYDTIACWTWNRNGWSKYLGVFDFAGGTPVHSELPPSALRIVSAELTIQSHLVVLPSLFQFIFPIAQVPPTISVPYPTI